MQKRRHPSDTYRRDRRFPTAGVVVFVLVLVVAFLVQGRAPSFIGQSTVSAADGDLHAFPQHLIIDEGCDPSASLPAQALLPAAARPYRDAMSLDAATDLRASVVSDQMSTLELSADIQERFTKHGALRIESLPLDAQHTVDLQLHRFSVFDHRSEIIVQDGQEPITTTAADVALFQGHVRGDSESRVFLGVGNGIVNGFVSYAGKSYSITSGLPNRNNRAASVACSISRLSAGESITDDAMMCGTDWIDQVDIAGLTAGASETDPAPALRVCDMAVVCDYDFYLRMDESVIAVTTYLAQVFGAASTIFERDFGITLSVRFIEVWMTPQDPFTECGINGLQEFRDYGNKHLLDRDWNLAYKVSGCGGGGRAFADGICLGEPMRGNNPYATSFLTGSFPTPIGPSGDNADLYLVPHEITHNFSIGHTHCYDPPLDSCRNDEASCYDGDVVCTRGTLMSYCFRCGGFGNIDLRFHPYIIDIVKSRLARSCLKTTTPGIYTANTGNQTLYIDSVVSTVDWLRASRDEFLISAGDTLAVYPIVDWNQVRVSSLSAQLLVYADDDMLASPLVVDVTVIRRRPFSDYTATNTVGCWPLTVEFQDLSSNGATDWQWVFGDGDTSSAASPVHTYTRPGTFTVRLTTANDCGVHTADRVTTIRVSEPALCCTSLTFVVPKNVVVQDAIDLWTCGAAESADSSDIRYVIAGDPADGAGVGIVRNRFVNIFPRSGWYGTADFVVQAITPDNCRCETPMRVVVNDPPEVTLLDPPVGVHVINRPYIFRWRDSDGNNNATIDLYYTNAADCSGGTRINAEPILEDSDAGGGSFIWSVYGLPDGYYRLRAVISDPYAQSETCAPGTILLDLTPPKTTATVTCLGVYQDGWCHGDIEVALNTTDTLTGVQGQFYSLNRGPWQEYTKPLDITRVGETLVEFFAVDSAGNVEQPRTTANPVQIDRLAPYIQRFSSGNALFRSGDYTVNKPEFTIVLGDEGVGVSPSTIVVAFTPGTASGPLRYTIDDDNVSYNPDTRRVSVVTDQELVPGTQRVTLTVSDVLGNEGSASTDFVIETGMAIRDVVNSPNPFRQETFFTFTLTEEPTEVRIRIFDLSGTLMRDIIGRDVHAGYNEVYWDGHSDNGLTLANGAYLYEIVATGPGGTAKHLDKLAILR
ncbi:MAG: PKD domain-containing protein [candidate division Zixibacteria bacterium]|nr:PKD domain-containing protein [candidate division Zixibacteria bacterium]